MRSLQEYARRPEGARRDRRIVRRARPCAPSRRTARSASGSIRTRVCSRRGGWMPRPPACASSGCAWSKPPRAASESSSRRCRSSSAGAPPASPRSRTCSSAARAAELLVIADAKRGDIGSTMDAYAEAWLTPGSPLEADAMTVNPFLGIGTLDGTFRAGRALGQGRVRPRRDEQSRGARRAAGRRHGRRDGVGRDHRRGLGAQRRTPPPTASGRASASSSARPSTGRRPASIRSRRPRRSSAPGFGHQGAGPADLAAPVRRDGADASSRARAAASSPPAPTGSPWRSMPASSEYRSGADG